MFARAKRFLGKSYETLKSIGKRIVKTAVEANTTSKSGYTPGVQSLLAKYGNDTVSNIRVCRDLVPESTESLLNAVSFGKWSELKKKYGYDRFFHLYILFDVGGQTLMLEKNQVINLSTYYRECKDTMPISGGGFTLNTLLDKTKSFMGTEKYFTYDALTNNCQNFILAILQANGLLTPAIRSFVFQDISKIVDELPSYMKPLAKGITDIARVVDTSLQKSVYNTNGKEGVENTSNAN
jgi:hypothetical protein